MVTEEQVEAAAGVLMQHGLNAPEQVIYGAARAALSAAEGVKPRVKPLVWRKVKGAHEEWWTAPNPLGGLNYEAHNLEDRADVDARYERRIMSALEGE